MAYFEAAAEIRDLGPAQSRDFEIDGLVILRAIAKHHYGPYGFLTEGVDWNNHVGQEHHIDGEEFGAIRYTEPLLNNQHLVEPTLFYLPNLARHAAGPDAREWRDLEGNVDTLRQSTTLSSTSSPRPGRSAAIPPTSPAH